MVSHRVGYQAGFCRERKRLMSPRRPLGNWVCSRIGWAKVLWTANLPPIHPIGSSQIWQFLFLLNDCIGWLVDSLWFLARPKLAHTQSPRGLISSQPTHQSLPLNQKTPAWNHKILVCNKLCSPSQNGIAVLLCHKFYITGQDTIFVSSLHLPTLTYYNKSAFSQTYSSDVPEHDLGFAVHIRCIWLRILAVTILKTFTKVDFPNEGF